MDIDYLEALKIKARYKASSLTKNDKYLMSRVSHDCKNEWQAILYLIEKAKRHQNEIRLSMLNDGKLFPLGDNQAACFNAIFRGKLFQPIARGRRKWIQNKELVNWGDSRLVYTGPTLDQADLDVLIGLYRVLSQESEKGQVEKIIDQKSKVVCSRIKMSRNSFLMEIGRTNAGSNYIWLKGALNRLRGSVEIHQKCAVVSGSMISRWGFDDDRFFVDLDQGYIRLFAMGTTFLDWSKRKKLKNGFAKWLQGYIDTHHSPHYQTVRKIMELCGSTSKRDRQFRERQLRPALQNLKTKGVVTQFRIDGYKVSWK